MTSVNDSFIFMKLNRSFDNSGREYNGHDVILMYSNDIQKRGYTWFSTKALHKGMAETKVQYYLRSIKQGRKVRILFALSKAAGGSNEISYQADVLDIQSYTIPTSIKTNDYPSVWLGEKSNIWIKITNLVPENKFHAKQFRITSTKADLDFVIQTSQYHFGYVELK